VIIIVDPSQIKHNQGEIKSVYSAHSELYQTLFITSKLTSIFTNK